MLLRLNKARQRFTRRTRYPDAAVNRASSEFEVNNWVISEFIVRQLVPIVGVHPFPLSELQLLVASVCRLKPHTIFEWGTHIGKSARIFSETAKYFGLPTIIHSIDLPDTVEHVEHPHDQRGLMVRGQVNVHLHRGDGVTKALELHNALSTDPPLLFFLDGDHAYETVKRELSTIVELLPDASILVHDTFFQSPDSRYNIGPYQAIKDVVVPLHRYSIVATNTGLPGMTLLTPRLQEESGTG